MDQGRSPFSSLRATGPGGMERRMHARAPVQILAEIDIPGLPVMFKAMIMDISAGGMRLRIPKIADTYLYAPFNIQWPMGGGTIKTQVYFIFRHSEHVISVRFLQTVGQLSSEISRYVFMVLKSREQGQKVVEPPAPLKTNVDRQERRRAMMRESTPMVESIMEAKDRHKSGTSKWLGKRIATHLDSD